METVPAPAKTSGLAIASLILGLLSLLLCCCGLVGLPAIVMGHVARRQIKASGGALTGGGLALTGLGTGYLSLLISIALLVGVGPQWPNVRSAIGVTTSMSQIYTGELKAGVFPADAGVTSVPAYLQVLVEKNGLTKEQVAMIDPSKVLIGNVAATDDGKTILLSSKPGLFSNGLTFLMLKDGEIEFQAEGREKKGVPAPREPQFLTD